MRYSLGTLMLVVVLIGALALVWFQWDAWIVLPPLTPEQHSAKVLDFRETYYPLSPDKKRRIEIRHVDEFPDGFWLVENAENPADDGRVFLNIPGNFLYVFFVDNDSVVVDDYLSLKNFHRRHPQ